MCIRDRPSRQARRCARGRLPGHLRASAVCPAHSAPWGRGWRSYRPCRAAPEPKAEARPGGQALAPPVMRGGRPTSGPATRG
eukprot:9246294-Alexandrium_andersonii.AAC.1